MTHSIVVAGDVLLDIDICGTVERVCPDAPAPVLSNAVSRRRPGGAGLAALLAATDAHVTLIAPFGDDQAADCLGELLRDRVDVVRVPWAGTTPIKTRLRAGNQSVARFDTGGKAGPFGPLSSSAFAALADADAVLVCDYGNGFTTSGTFETLWQCASTLRRPVVWDPHPRGSDPRAGCTLVTPNCSEARAASCSAAGDDVGAMADRARELRKRWRAGAVAITAGADGVVVALDDESPMVVPAPTVEHPSDTCGAGDAFAAAAAASLAAGMLPSEAVVQAVLASSAFVAAGGAAGISECRGLGWQSRMPTTSHGLLDRRDALLRLEQVRAQGGRIVATGGCFDLLHAGHVAALRAARRLGDHLVVLLNSDESVARLKGAGRPLQSAADRAAILHALDDVDTVIVFDEDNPIEALRRVRPSVWVKGGDYSGTPLPEAEVMAEWGGHAVIVPYLGGRSTSSLVAKASRE